MIPTNRKPLRIFYAAGPGNVIGTYRLWKDGRADPSQVNMTISGMFFEACRECGDEAYVVASCRQPGMIRDDQFQVAHRPIPFQNASGLLYHLGQILAAFQIICSAIWFQADIALISEGSAHWFPLRLLPIFGIQVVPSLHCVLWRKYRTPGTVPRFIRKLNAGFFIATAHRILSMSRDITAQVEEMTSGKCRPVIEFLPTYQRQCFAGMPPPVPDRRPFRVFYAGRIERSKGVFDLLSIAKRFKHEGIDDVEFDVCGTGGALDELRRHAVTANVTDRFLLHGYCNQPEMREKYAASHIVIVPTTTDFIEGFNQVVSEAILAGRPVITSAVCPALSYVHEACIEVPPDDARAYGDAILQLRNDPKLYQTKRDACRAVEEPFYDESQGWGAALRAALLPLRVASRRWTYAQSEASLRRPNHVRHMRVRTAGQKHQPAVNSWMDQSKIVSNSAEVFKNQA